MTDGASRRGSTDDLLLPRPALLPRPGAPIRVLRALQRIPTPAALAGSLVLLVLVGTVDYATGDDLSLALFYLLVVGLAAWTCRLPAAMAIAGLAAASGLVLDLLGPDTQVRTAVAATNAAFRFAFFLAFAYGSILLRHALAELDRRASRDELTGLRNRRSFYEVVEVDRRRALRTGRPISLLYLDLDNLKVVNDERGHEAGDALLLEFAERLRAVLRPGDWTARLGGDEFAVCLAETDDADTAAVLARLTDELAQPIESGFAPSASIGAGTWYVPPDTVEEMVRTADDLMYRAKQRRPGSWEAMTVGARSAA